MWLFLSSLGKKLLTAIQYEVIFRLKVETKKRTSPGPAPRGKHSGAVPPNENCIPLARIVPQRK